MPDDLRDQIITNKTSERMLDAVSPIYENSYVGLWMYEIMGREFQSMWDILDTFPAQFYPESATWSLPLWERRYGLETDESLDIETRRERIMEKRDKRGWFNNFRLETWLNEKTGGIVKIIDFVDLYTFGVQIESDATLLPSYNQDEAVKYINSHKPSHLSYKIIYRANRKIQIYVGVVLYGAVFQDLGKIEAPDFTAQNFLADGLGNILVDGLGLALTC